MNETRALGIIKKIMDLGLTFESGRDAREKIVSCRVSYDGVTVSIEEGSTLEDALNRVNDDLDHCWMRVRSNLGVDNE